MKHTIKILRAEGKDVMNMWDILHESALDAYPNEERRITKAHIEHLCQLIEKKMPFIGFYIDNGLNFAWKAMEDTRMVGFLIVSKTINKQSIELLYVLPSHQREGIGKRLMEKGLECLNSKQNIFLEVVSYNKPAIRFYNSFDFVECGPFINADLIMPDGSLLPESGMVKVSALGTNLCIIGCKV